MDEMVWAIGGIPLTLIDDVGNNDFTEICGFLQYQ